MGTTSENSIVASFRSPSVVDIAASWESCETFNSVELIHFINLLVIVVHNNVDKTCFSTTLKVTRV